MTYRTLITIAISLFVVAKMWAQVISFELVGKSIIVEATVNKLTGHFILDTGTPYLILNNKYFKGTPTGEKMVGLVGKQIDICKNEVSLSMGNLRWGRMESTILPLDHLSRAKGRPIMGLIGNTVLNRFQMTIDFDAQQLELIKASGKAVATGNELYPDVTLKFLWRGGIPVIKTMVGEESLFFGFDTGAGINALNEEQADKLADQLIINQKVNVSGMGEGRQRLESGFIHHLTVEDYFCPAMPVVLVSLSRFKGGQSQLNSIDGFLGYEFLKHFRTRINFKKRTIHLYYRNDFARTYLVAK